MDEAWLNLVRAARDLGDISSLFPEGITRAYDLPFTIHNAIIHALHFLSYEELPLHERPPKRIWQDGEKMKQWWDEVKRTREEEVKGGGSAPQMSRNALADYMLRGARG